MHLVLGTKQRQSNFLPSHFLLAISGIFLGGLSFLLTRKKLSPGQWLSLLLSVPCGGWGAVGGGGAVGYTSSQGQGAELGSEVFWETQLLLVVGSKVTSFP